MGILEDLRALRIQGATNVALASLRYLEQVLRRSKNPRKDLEIARRRLFSTRPTEPLMRNLVNYVLREEDFREAINSAKNLLKKATTDISLCANRLKENCKVMTHCHSSSVISVLKKVKGVEVFVTETRPLYQGRETAKELLKHKIKTHFITDSAAGILMDRVDYVIVGCDAITSEISVVNKVGTYPLAVLAKRENVPFYVATTLLKFDPQTIYTKGRIEVRSSDEVWKARPKGLDVINPAFDITPEELITGFMTEFGVYAPEMIYDLIEKHYPWILH